MSLTPMPIPIEDYDAIQAAVMETGRGRWFLNEYARRNRHADTEVVLEAIGRIARMAGSPADRDVELAELAKFVQDARRAIVHVHETTGAAPLDYVVETMRTIEERLESLSGKTRAAAKLVAIADAKPAEIEDIEPESILVAANLEVDDADVAPPAPVAGTDEIEMPASEDRGAADTAREDLIEAATPPETAEDLDDIELFADEAEAAPELAEVGIDPSDRDEQQVLAVGPAANAPIAEDDFEISIAGPVIHIAAGAESSGDEAPVAIAAIPDSWNDQAPGDVLEIEDELFATETEASDEADILETEPEALPTLATLLDENAVATDDAGFAEAVIEEAAPQLTRRKPLPDSLRPDLPLVTAAELDALSFEEKIVLFA